MQKLSAFGQSREGKVAALCLLLIAFAAAVSWKKSLRPAAADSATAPVAATPAAAIPAPAAAPMAATPAAATAPAPAGGETPTAGAIAHPAPVADSEAVARAKSNWVAVWGRQLPDPNAIDMDVSHVGEPGGKAIAIPYVAPKPIANGTMITNANGTMSQVIDGRVVNPDGSSATIDGDKLMRSDGALGVMVGNQILWSDGTKSGY